MPIKYFINSYEDLRFAQPVWGMMGGSRSVLRHPRCRVFQFSDPFRLVTYNNRKIDAEYVLVSPRDPLFSVEWPEEFPIEIAIFTLEPTVCLDGTDHYGWDDIADSAIGFLHRIEIEHS